MGCSEIAEELLAGPRGRRLCWQVAEEWAGPAPGPAVCRPEPDESGRALVEFLDEVEGSALAAIAGADDEPAFLGPLAEAVDSARYWDEPDHLDRALSAPRVRRALRPVARSITAAPGVRWWWSTCALDRQERVQFLDGRSPGTAPEPSPAAAELRAWRTATADDEIRARRRPADPAANVGGFWWSSPRLTQLVSTTRTVSGAGVVGLSLVEDGMGWTEARSWPMRPQREPRVREISGPAQWCELTARYPLEVSLSRRHDWWRATGRAGRWLVPDWEAVAADYDAVHLGVAGYLTTAGRALPVGEARTVLAGWDPDETIWLTDVLATCGPATRWRSEDGLDWSPVPER